MHGSNEEPQKQSDSETSVLAAAPGEHASAHSVSRFKDKRPGDPIQGASCAAKDNESFRFERLDNE